jgi:PrsW family intramembrane metalloprotease
MFTQILTFLGESYLPLTIIALGGLIYTIVIWRISRMSARQIATLFFTGIVVITCIFLPFNWSIHNAGAGKEVGLFFFQLNIEGSNFIDAFKGLLEKQGLPISTVDHLVTLFLAFLEEFAKLTLLILCVRKSLRWPVMIVYIIVAYTVLSRLWGAGIEQVELIVTSVIAFIGLILLWILTGTPIRTLSVSDYIYNIAILALGFAFAENIKYFVDLSQAGETREALVNNAFLRSIFGYLSHMFFSMVCVAIYARGRFAFLRVIDDVGNLTVEQRALGWKNYTKLKSVQGFWLGVIIASIIHGIYNIFIAQTVLIPTIILVVGFLVLELFVLHKLRNNTKYGNIEQYLQ